MCCYVYCVRWSFKRLVNVVYVWLLLLLIARNHFKTLQSKDIQPSATKKKLPNHQTNPTEKSYNHARHKINIESFFLLQMKDLQINSSNEILFWTSQHKNHHVKHIIFFLSSNIYINKRNQSSENIEMPDLLMYFDLMRPKLKMRSQQITAINWLSFCNRKTAHKHTHTFTVTHIRIWHELNERWLRMGFFYTLCCYLNNR